jgi:hypothetical protein
LSKLTVTIESIPSPEKSTGRRIVLQAATGRVKWRPLRTSVNFRVGTHLTTRPRAAATIACGAEEMTMRALEPLCRASTNLPSTLMVWVTFIAAGSLMLTSVRSSSARR